MITIRVFFFKGGRFFCEQRWLAHFFCCNLRALFFPSQMRRRVVVTGVGLVTPLSALGARETWEALLACRTGVRSLIEDDMPPVRIWILSSSFGRKTSSSLSLNLL